MSAPAPLPAQVSDPAQRADWLEELRRWLPAEQAERVAALLQWAGWVIDLLELKNLSIARLRRLCFGSPTESLRNVCGGAQPVPAAPKAKAKGHGRCSHRAYTGARRVSVPHPVWRAGQACPQCQRGKLRRLAEPAAAIQIQAQPPVGATVYELERLRCNTCGQVFSAPPPAEAGVQKYDPSVGVMAGLLRYGSGLPLCRLERLQASLGVPLPASVQWEQAQLAAESLEPVFEQLIYLAAQSELVCNDDTTMRVSALRREIQAEAKPERTGIFTSGIASQSEGHPIALFFTGRAHAGENLAQVLGLREANRPPPLHMGDGNPSNTPGDRPVVACNCNAHCRREFVELEEYFPQECRLVLESYAEVYRVDAQAKTGGLSPQQRLEAHQAHSLPVLEKLKACFTQWLESKQVEPNSTLGGAINYALKRWTQLTQFLRLPGAPVDNNVTERILKRAILHRKNSLFYRTQRGARVGDLFMSLIETCRASQANPFDYLLAVVKNAAAAKAAPRDWLPWNYRAQLPPATAAAP